MLRDNLPNEKPVTKIVSAKELQEMEDEEWRKMIEDVENGVLTREELRARNCVHWSEGWEIVEPW